jgi:molybdenum cofactor biosynthesis enzyme MoaA
MIYLNLELTDRCNVKCIMCGQAYSSNVHDTPDRYMSTETWSHLLEGLADVDEEISLCPHWLGDPTVHPEFAPMIREAFQRNTGNRLFRFFKVHTNGALLHRKDGIEAVLDCAASRGQAPDTFQFLHFSLDALTRDVFTHVKGVDLHQRTYANVLKLLRRRRERGLAWPKVTLAFVVMEENRRDAAPFLRFWRDTFAELGEEAPQVTWDWPIEARDTLYFRRLNHEDQDAATRLHRDVLVELGVIADHESGELMPGSF